MTSIRFPPPLADQRRKAELGDLVRGTRIWLGDPRQTPAEITELNNETGSFTLRLLDFEDAGANWLLPFWDIEKFFVATDTPRLPAVALSEIEACVATLNRRVVIPAGQEPQIRSEARIVELESRLGRWLGETELELPDNPPDDLESGEALAALEQARQGWMTHCGVAGMEEAFVRAYVSNPHAGETVKAHRMALADLGLCAYEGEVLRDKGVLQQNGGSRRRAEHILARLAFVRFCFGKMDLTRLPLYRVIYAGGALSAPRNTGFVSTTLSRSVAERFFAAGQTKEKAAMFWAQIDVARVFMTCLETATLNERFKEAEAVILFAPEQSPF